MRWPVGAFAMLVAGAPAAAAPHGLGASVERAVAQASAASGLPAGLIRGVIGQESAGDPRAVSRAGALGLMQLMPGTWRELRARLALGPDPFDVHDNILAGAAYLREMRDRFGEAGGLAAYNAGPARYGDVLAGRARLPAETAAYVARLAPWRGPSARWTGAVLTPTSAGLFPLDAERAR